MRLPCCLGAFCLEPFWGCCLFRFLPVVKATDFAGFPFFRCLFPLHKPRKATDFGDSLDFRCLFHFLPAVKATDFAGFPFFRCLLATILALKATDFEVFSVFRCLFCFLLAVKATDFAGFPFFRCLLASSKMRRIPCRQARNGKCKVCHKKQKQKSDNQAYCSLFVLIRILHPKFYCKSACYYLPHNHAPGKHQKNRCRKKTSNQCKLHPCRNACP